MDDLEFEKVSHNHTFTTECISGLSVEEMDYILDGNGDGKDIDDRLCETLNKRTNSTMYDAWRYGYGIYGIKHFGGHLLVTIGNSCD